MHRNREWPPGDVALLRHVRKGDIFWAVGVRVVEHGDDGVVLYLAPGTPFKSLKPPGGHDVRDFVRASVTVDLTWKWTNTLWFLRAGEPWATVLFWDEAWQFLCWYINFEEPLRLIPQGFESMDQTLDLVLHPDRERLEWKDEDEFTYGIEHGWYTEAQRTAMKRHAEGIIPGWRAGEPPFEDRWLGWRPDPVWQPPALPVGWDLLM